MVEHFRLGELAEPELHIAVGTRIQQLAGLSGYVGCGYDKGDRISIYDKGFIRYYTAFNDQRNEGTLVMYEKVPTADEEIKLIEHYFTYQSDQLLEQEGHEPDPPLYYDYPPEIVVIYGKDDVFVESVDDGQIVSLTKGRINFSELQEEVNEEVVQEALRRMRLGREEEQREKTFKENLGLPAEPINTSNKQRLWEIIGHLDSIDADHHLIPPTKVATLPPYS